jgi:putative transposase
MDDDAHRAPQPRIADVFDRVLRRPEKGSPDAIRVTWPQATVQTCVVHMVRNSLRYASKKHWGEITRQMRQIYRAPTVAAAVTHLAEFADAWRDTYPAMIGAWENAWGEFVPSLEFPIELRKIVYTTNAIESLNARFRRPFAIVGTSRMNQPR